MKTNPSIQHLPQRARTVCAALIFACFFYLAGYCQDVPGKLPISWMHPELGASRNEKWKDVLSGDGELAEAGDGHLFWIGRSRSNPENWQYMIFGEDTTDDVLVRFDLENEEPHVNIQIGRDRKGKHTPVKPGDKVIVEVKGGKVKVVVNGEVKDELPAPPGTKEGTIERDTNGAVRIRDKSGTVVAERAPRKAPADEKQQRADDGKGQVTTARMTAHPAKNEPLINVPHPPDSAPLINVPAPPRNEPLVNVPHEPDNRPLINVPASPDNRPLINVPHPLGDIRGQWFLTAGAKWKGHSTGVESTANLELEKALLTEDWSKVADLLDKVDAESSSPVLRLLKGHACLALNQNNDSLSLFVGVQSKADLMEYQKWATSFSTRNKNKAVAYYFEGDAFARSQAWSDSLRVFSAGLQRSSDHPLLLNARGIMFAQMKDWYKAIADFEGAIKANPDFADAYANRGTMNLNKKAGAKGAIAWFQKARDHSKQFSLALYNEGFAKIASGLAEEGPKEIKEAAAQLICFSSKIDTDMGNIVVWVRKKAEAEAKEINVADVGSQLDRVIGEVSGGNVGALNQAARLLGNHPEFSATFNRNLDQVMRQKPELTQPIQERINAGFDWTKSEVGGARGWLNTLQGLNLGGAMSATKGLQTSQRQTELSTSRQLDLSGGLGFAAFAQQHQIKTDMDNKGWGTMRSQSVINNTVGGVSASLANAFVDEGDWPIEAHYGLNYEVSAPAIEKRTK